MDIGVISDVHANYHALKRVLDDLQKKGVDKIICAGDLVGYYNNPNKVINELKCGDIESVRGNHDHAVVKGIPNNFRDTARSTLTWTEQNITPENKEYLSTLPERRIQWYEGTSLYIVHGSPSSPLSEYVYKQTVDDRFLLDEFDLSVPDFLIMGHTHQSFVKELDDVIILNPGSVGQPRDGESTASYAVVNTEDHTAARYRVEYDIKKVADEMKKQGLPAELIHRLFEGK